MKTREEGCLVAQFYLETEGELIKTAKETVRHETAGKWDRPGIPSDLFKRSAGYLLDHEQTGPSQGIVAFAYPPAQPGPRAIGLHGNLGLDGHRHVGHAEPQKIPSIGFHTPR
jgi:hypothetical protein